MTYDRGRLSGNAGGSDVADFEIARERNDIVLKQIAAVFRGAVLERFGVFLPPIVAPLSTELPLLVARSRRADYVFRLADESVLHLEFQTSREEGDFVRFAEYNLALHIQHKVPVWTVVLWGSSVRQAPDMHGMGSLTLQIQSVLLGMQDGTGLLDGLAAKVERGEALDVSDQAALALLPLMHQRRPLREAEAAETLRRVAEALPLAERSLTVGALAALAWRYNMDEEQIRSLLEVLQMTNALDEMLDDAIRRGLNEGEILASQEALRVVVRERFGAVPDGLERRIAGADRTTLSVLIARAATIADVAAL